MTNSILDGPILDLPDYMYGALLLEPRKYLDKAIIGFSRHRGEMFVVYDRAKIVEAFMKMNEWTEAEAEEWVGINTDDAGPIITDLV